MLFNLDTVISVEPVGDKSVIQTRWGRVTVREDLDSILDQAHADQAGVSAPQLVAVRIHRLGRHVPDPECYPDLHVP